MLEALGRFERPTCGLGNRRSIHLSYRAPAEQNSIFSLFRVKADWPVMSDPSLCSGLRLLRSLRGSLFCNAPPQFRRVFFRNANHGFEKVLRRTRQSTAA